MQLKCWVQPGEEEEKRKEIAALNAPPPTTLTAGNTKAHSSTSNDVTTDLETETTTTHISYNSVTHKQVAVEDRMAVSGPGFLSAPPPIHGGPRRSAVTSRYAAMPNISMNAPKENDQNATDGSILSGLPPLGAFSGGFPQAFKPATVFKPASTASDGSPEGLTNQKVEENWQNDDDASEYHRNFADNDESKISKDELVEETELHVKQTQDPLRDPAILEVLSFWSYYRSCGYDVEDMNEWVQQNYGEDFIKIDYEALLQDEQVVAVVKQHIELHRRKSREPSPSSARPPSEEVDEAQATLLETTRHTEQACGEELESTQNECFDSGFLYNNHEANNQHVEWENQSKAQFYGQDSTMCSHDAQRDDERDLFDLPVPNETQGYSKTEHENTEYSGQEYYNEGGYASQDANPYHVYSYTASNSLQEVTPAVAESEQNAPVNNNLLDTSPPELGYETPEKELRPERIEDNKADFQTGTQFENFGHELHAETHQLVPGPPLASESEGIAAFLANETESIDTLSSRSSVEASRPNDTNTVKVSQDIGMNNFGVERFGNEREMGHVVDQEFPSEMGPQDGFESKEENVLNLAIESGPPLQENRDATATEYHVSQPEDTMIAEKPSDWEGFDINLQETEDLSHSQTETGVVTNNIVSGENKDVVDDGVVDMLPEPGLPMYEHYQEESVAAGEEQNEGEQWPVTEPYAAQAGPWDASLDERAVTGIEEDSNFATDEHQNQKSCFVDAANEVSEQSKLQEPMMNGSEDDLSPSELSDARQQVEDLQKQLDLARSEAQAFKDAEVRANDQISMMEAEIERLKVLIDEVKKEKEVLQQDLEQLQKASADEKSELQKEIQSIVHDSQSKIEELEDEREKLQCELSEAVKDASDLEGKCNEFSTIVSDLNEKIEEITAEKDALQESLELKDDAIKALSIKAKELEELSAIMEKKQEEIEDAKKASESFSELLQEAEKREQQAVQNALAAEERLKDLEADFQRQIEEAKAEASEEAFKAANEESTAKISSLEDELQELISQMDEKDGEIMQLEAQVMNLKSAKEEVEASAGKISQEAENASSRLKEIEKKFVLAKKKIALQQSQHEKLESQISTLKSQLDEATSTSHRDEDELAELSHALDEAQEVQTALQKEVNELQNRLEEMSQEKDAEIDSMTAENARLSQMLLDAQAIEEDMRAQISNYSMMEGVQERMKQLEATLEDVEQRAKNWEQYAKELEHRSKELGANLEIEREARSQDASAAASLKSDIAVLQSTLNATECQLAELEHLQEAFQEQENAISDLKQQLETSQREMHAMSFNLENTRRENESLRQAADRKGKFGEPDIEEITEEVETLRSQLIASSEVASSKEEELRKYKLQLVKTRKLRAADAEKISNLEAELQDAIKKLESQNLAINSTQNSLENMKNTQLEEERNRKACMQEEIETLKQRLAMAETELGSVKNTQEEVKSLKAAVVEAEDGMKEALSALGIEEAKVARLAEMLNERGVADHILETELETIEEVLLEDSE